jgi:CPA1 family monovalent cation:H+ antiporter
VVDEILNAVLFLLIGLEAFAVLPNDASAFLIGLACIPLAVGARLIAVSLAVTLLRFRRTFSPGVIPILTWGGLRGGISVALVLSLPDGDERTLMLTATYVVVIFSIVVQGLTMKSLVRRVVAGGPVDESGARA